MKKYAFCISFCLIFAVLILWGRGISAGALSDAFAVPGILLLCVAAMGRLAAAGALEGIRHLWRWFLPGKPRNRQAKPPKDPTPLWITGAVSLALGTVCLLL